MMPRLRLIALVLVLAACSASPGSASVAPSPSAGAASAAASGPCLDRAELADNAETVGPALKSVIDALKASNADQARSSATTASTGLRKIADFAASLKPEAATAMRDAATKLDAAAAGFPAGVSTVEQIQTEFEAGYELARTVVCPD